MFQVIIGNQGVQNPKEPEAVSNYDSLNVHDLVVVQLDEEESSDPPYIGKVLEVLEDDVIIHWMRGGYHRQWKEWYTGCGKNRQPYCDTIAKRSILLYGFSLTRKGCLPKETAANIKSAYEDEDC